MKWQASDSLWRIVNKSLVVILFLMFVIVWPIIVISLLVISLGSYIFIDGIFSLVNAIKKKKTAEANWDWLFLNGMFGIFAGILTFFNPFITIAVATFLLLSK